MNIKEALERLEENHRRVLAAVPEQLRLHLTQSSLIDDRSALVIGPRGTGKTTLLLSTCKKKDFLYLSADHPLVSRFGLWEIAEEAIRSGYLGLAIDEVHFAPSWSQDLKTLYDSYPKISIYASDSSSLIMRKGTADLSRRFPKERVPLLSFREFIHLSTGRELSRFNVLEEPEHCEEMLAAVNIPALFREYLKSGFRPIFLEGKYNVKTLAIIEKTIFSDVPFVIPTTQEHHLRLMNAIMGYLASSTVPTLNIDALSTEWSVGKEKLYDLLFALEAVELISIVRHKSDKKASGKGAKIFFTDPSFYSVLGGAIANIREAFVVTMARQSNREIFACKDESKGDFIFDSVAVEVGGKSKKRKSATFVIRDDIERPTKASIPLWSLGFLY